jgi:peptidoglycan/LPS O-acetylase OafA/YrhL
LFRFSQTLATRKINAHTSAQKRMEMEKDTQQELYPNSAKIEELESIRGIAALLIVFFHLPKWNPILDIGLVKNGYLMVELFFVLSGFVIFNAYAEKITTQKDLFRFQLLRFGRLYPVHLLFLLVFLGIEIAKHIASTKFGINSPNTIPFETNNFSAFLKNIFLISSVLPNQSPTYNGPSWSISVEFYTYLVFAASILLLKKSSVMFFTTLSFISLLMLATEKTFGFDSILRCFAGFFIGCLTAKFTKGIKTNFSNFYSVIVFFAIVSFLQLKTTGDFDLLIYFLTAALIATLVLSKNGTLKIILRFRFLTWLGAVSYSVYMSHGAILWVVNQVIRVVLKKPELVVVGGRSTPQLSQLEALFACVVVASVVLIVSAFVYNFIEKPMREKSRRFAFSKLN